MLVHMLLSRHCGVCLCTKMIRLCSLGCCSVELWLMLLVRMNSIESLMYDGSFWTRGLSQASTELEMFSVTELTLDTIALIPIGFLWIFLREYSWDVL